jgi:hypothetical protein
LVFGAALLAQVRGISFSVGFLKVRGADAGHKNAL